MKMENLPESKDGKPFKLGRTNQCEKCPWKKSTNPFDIPNGYDVAKHEALRSTIADPDNPVAHFSQSSLKVMSCHDSPESKPQYCVGWLDNQLNEGNNIPLRLKMRNCTNIGSLKTVGKQHKTFDETLPKEKRNGK